MRRARRRVHPDHAADLAAWTLADPDCRAGLGDAISRSRTGTVHRTIWSLGGQPAIVYVKVFNNRDAVHALKSLVRSTRGRYAWDGATGLIARGVPAAVPLLFEEERTLGLVHRRSLFACREIDGVDWGTAFDARPADEAAAFLIETGAWIGRLHAAGIDHRALQPKNLLVGPDDAIVPIEYDRIRFRRRIAWKSRAQALGHLVHERLDRLADDLVERTLAAYSAAAGLPPASRPALGADALAFARERRARSGA